ncbi:MAG: endonuclease/exonuclease/phosphatase family protein [Flavobacteriales bacterium]|nr:endonuclease/exonuclease/phosphatase family protein [Flavobacteriales bacterium]
MRIKEVLYLSLILVFSNNLFSQEITVMTYNIRNENSNDGINVWINRREKVSEVILNNKPAIVGLQEALKGQVVYLSGKIKYKFIGKGRDDGKMSGEYSPILYDESRVELLKHGMFWLSETPSKPSLGWDACCKRVVTWGKFKDNGKEFYFFNTHFDNEGQVAIKESSKLLLYKVKEIAGDNSLIILGDFNFEPSACSYQYLVDPELNISVQDSYTHADKTNFDRPTTFRGFDVNDREREKMIDYIFYKNGIRVLEYSIDSSNNNVAYFSDHLPIIVKAKFVK